MVKIKDIEKKKKYTDLMWFDRLPTSMGTRKKTFTMYRIRVTVDPAFRWLECVSHSNGELDFYLKNLIFIDYLKMTWSRHLFLFYF